MRRYLDAFGVRYELVPTLVRGLDYYTRTTWEFVGPGGRLAEHALAAAAATTAWPRSSAAGRRRASGSAPGSSGCCSRSSTPARPPAEDEGIDVFFVCDDGADRAAGARRGDASCAQPGVRADADYAGRSVKGQLTQAGRLGAKRRVVVGRRAETDMLEECGP